MHHHFVKMQKPTIALVMQLTLIEFRSATCLSNHTMPLIQLTLIEFRFLSLSLSLLYTHTHVNVPF
jgi:hypothetical protein